MNRSYLGHPAGGDVHGAGVEEAVHEAELVYGAQAAVDAGHVVGLVCYLNGPAAHRDRQVACVQVLVDELWQAVAKR